MADHAPSQHLRHASQRLKALRTPAQRSGFFLEFLGFFDFHIAKFVRVEDFATFLALDVLDVLFARYHAHFGMFAGGVH